MAISLFLAKSLGLFYIIVGAGMLINGRYIKLLLKDYLSSPSVSFLGGFCALIVGILIVVSHNIWHPDWRVVVTLLGWTSIIKGVLWGLFPQLVINRDQKWLLNDRIYMVASLVTFLIGVFLCYEGFKYEPF